MRQRMTTREAVWLQAYNAALSAGVMDRNLRIATADQALEDFNTKFLKQDYREK